MPNQYLPPVIAIPSMLLIIGISNSSPMIITFTIPLDSANYYHINQKVKLTVPITWGMFQANGLIGKILAVDSTTITLNIDSSLFDIFIYNPTSKEAPASLAPSGSQNLEYDNTTDKVPFQSLNNIGN